MENCSGGPNANDFWPTMKTYLTNKGTSQQKGTVLCENECLATNQDITKDSNSVFVNVQLKI